MAYLYRDRIEAESGVGVGGSGFVVGVELDDAFVTYVVTCAHVALQGAPVVRAINSAGELTIRDNAQWIRHPNGDDVAIALLEVLDPTKLRRTAYIGPDAFATRYDLLEPDEQELVEQRAHRRWIYGKFIGVGDDTVTLGRFLGRDGGETNVPIARFGNIAHAEVESIEFAADGERHLQQCFLVEARSFNGFSGSAVYTYHDAISFDGDPLPVGESTRDFCLLGIDCGHLPLDESRGEVALPGKPRRRANSGIMTVIPAWKIQETIYSSEVKDLTARAVRSVGG